MKTKTNTEDPLANYNKRHRSLIESAHREGLLSYSNDAYHDHGLPFYVPVNSLAKFIDFIVDNSH